MPEKKRKLIRSEKFSNVAKLFRSYFCSPKTKSTSQARIKPSSVARGAGGRAIAPPIGMSTKMQNETNTTFLALLRLFYALEWTK